MITLAIDTSTPAPSLAIARDGEPVFARVVEATDAGRRVAEEIHLMLVAAGLEVNDLDRIVVGVGPGGFTGLRIGMATALGLGQALGIPVVGVCSLETLAIGMSRVAPDSVLVPVIDARRREVFTAAYEPDGRWIRQIAEPRATDPEGFGEMLDRLSGPVVIAGDGRGRVAEVSSGRGRVLPGGPAHAIDAANSIDWVDHGGDRPVTPMYLRLPDAEVNRRRRDAPPA